jgi:IclR family transcriptional regulator, acetate operon repressor
MVQSVDRTLDVLEALASADDDLSLSQLCVALELPLGTIHRLLGTLIARGYAAQDSQSRRYGPGPKLLEIAARATSHSRFSLRRLAQPYLRALTEATGETSNLIVLQGGEIVYVEQVTSARLVHMFTAVGQRAPLYCTGGGKAILAGLPEQQAEVYLASAQLRPWTPKTITDRERFRQELALTRQRGYAVDDEEREEGVRCVAAPIFDHSGLCVAAISISGPSSRVTLARLAELGPQLCQAAADYSAQLGYHSP